MRIKRFIPLLALCMLPVTARAALQIEPADSIIRSGSTITLSGSVGDYIISGSETNIQVIAESGVQRITLSGANMTAPDGLDALTANGSLELTLIGESTITGGSANGIAGKGIVLPQGSLLTIHGEGSLNACGGETWYDSANPSTGTGGTAISGSVAIHDGASVTAKGGKSTAGPNENKTYGGNGVDGDVTVYSGKLEATGGAAEKGRMRNEGGNGVYGDVTVYGGLLDAAGGSAKESMTTFYIINEGGNGVKGNAAVYGGQLNATGASASGGYSTDSSSSYIQGGHGVDGSAAIYGGRLTAEGGSASECNYSNIGGNGINGAFTAAGGYALATGGDALAKNGDTPDTGSYSSASIGAAALSTATSPVIIGSDQSLLTASMGTGTSPVEPLNGGSFYTAPKDETAAVSGKRSLETKEVFAVTYACAYDGCTDTHTHYAEGYATYTAATIDELGFSPHFVFAGFVDDQGKAVDSLFLCGPIRLKATWKTVFTFDAGEGGTGTMPPLDAVHSSGSVTLPACGFAAPAGYRFAGWKIEGNDQLYAPGDEIPAANEIRLTAVWELIPIPPASGMPNTGDSSAPMLWLFLLLGSCAWLSLLRAKVRN